MELPYAMLNIYLGSVNSEGLREGKLYGRLPTSESIRRTEIQRRVRANQIIDRNMGRDRVKIEYSLIGSPNEASELSDFIIEEIPNSESLRSLLGCCHGRLSFKVEMFMQGHTIKTRAKLIEVLLKAPYQPEISREVYIGAQIMDEAIDEPKELRKLWRSRLKFEK